MPTYYYGVDSVEDARQVLPVLHAAWGVYPSVYARYVVGGFVTSAAECAAILALGIRVIHVCNFGDAGTVGGSYADGMRDAQNALAAMRATGCPAGQGLLFRDIESGWIPSRTYLLGWCQGLANAKQQGGFYANAEWATFDTPYASITGNVARAFRLIWTSEPENVGYVPPPGPAWNPYAPPSDPSSAVGWQFVEQPGPIPNIDCNLWTEEAYNAAWHNAPPTPPVQTVYHVVQPGALKAHPNHGPGVALGTNGEHLDRLEPGTTLTRTGADVVTAGEKWLPCRLDRPDQIAHGYYPLASLK